MTMPALLLAIAAVGPAAADPRPADVTVVPTYEAAGLYWSAPGGKPEGCKVRFRKRGEAAWRDGLDLWYDARNNECRGSLVYLTPGTAYEAQLGLAAQVSMRTVAFATWPDRRPVARTVPVAGSDRMLVIREGGSRERGYVVYDGRGAVLEGNRREPYNILIEASYVIVRGLTLKGATQDAIRIGGNVTDVVIEDNDISGWGRLREGGKGGQDMDSGIRAVCRSCPEVERITIQRNRIHDPRHGANSWSDGHPEGPQGITIGFCAGNHVIRHNKIYSRNGNKFNDVIGGEENMSREGFPNADSDIYANEVSDGWDDGIEAEGGNRNVRIWANTIDNTGTGIATTATSIGPVYIFRNVYVRNRFYAKVNADDDERQAFFKAGSEPGLGDGRRYIFHNTMQQPEDPRLRNPLGAGLGISGTGAQHLVNNTWSINNLYHLWKQRGSMVSEMGKDNLFRNDLVVGGKGVNLAPARDHGQRIPNFNDDFSGAAPDIGAEESRPK